MRRLAPWTLVFLLACSGTPGLRPAPVDPVVVEIAPSPWDDVDGGELPDLLFAVAWHPLEASCDDCDDAQWRARPLRYSVVDSRGTVRADFPLPWPADQIDHLSLQAAGPGAALVTVSGDALDGALWRALRLDADASEATEVLRLLNTGELQLPASGRSLAELEPSRSMLVAADPNQPSRAWLLAGRADPDGDPRLDQLHRVDLFDPGIEPTSWLGADLLSEPLQASDGGAPAQPWTLQALAVDGQTHLQLGVDGALGGEPRRSLERWSAEAEAVVGSMDLLPHGALSIRTEPSLRGGAALFQRGPVSSFCGDPSFVVVQPDGAIEVDAGDSRDCGWAGPLLDATAPTFAWFGFSLDAGTGPGHRLEISHRGDDVWSVDRFGDGIEERPFLLLDAVVLPAP